jgi:dTDP-L-rhamnose 4-epimerase
MHARVLITGGAGFIGSTLARRLIAEGDSVTAMDVLHPQVHPTSAPASDFPIDADLVVADVTHAATWPAILERARPDVVVHLAAETGTGQSLSEASRHGMVNVVGTTELLDAMYRSSHKPSHLILASSRAVYGEGDWQTGDGARFSPTGRQHDDLVAQRWDPIAPQGGIATPLPSRADRTEPRPSNIYAATKLAQEHLLNAWGTATGTAVSVLRLQNVYGPGQSLTNSYTGVLALFARLSNGGHAIDVYEDGEIWRDFVYVEDVVSALVAAMRSKPTRNRLLDVGSGEPATILTVAKKLAAITGAPEPAVSGRFRDGDVRAASCDISRTTQELGYQPAWSLDAGLRSLCDWVKTQS